MTQSLNTNRLGVCSHLFGFVVVLLPLLSSSTSAQYASIVEPRPFNFRVQESNLRYQLNFNKGMAVSKSAQNGQAFAQLQPTESLSTEDGSPKEKTNGLSEENESGSDTQTNTTSSDSDSELSDSSISVQHNSSAPKENEALSEQENEDKASRKSEPRYSPLPEPVLTTDETVESLSTDELIEAQFSDKRQRQSNPAALAFVIGGATAVISVVFLVHGLANTQTDYSKELKIGSAITGAVAVVALGTGLYLLLTNTTDHSVQATRQRRSRSSTMEQGY